MSNLSVKEMINAGVHFGHQSKYWNPKMRPYIYTTYKKLHIINLEKSIEQFSSAINFIEELIKNNSKILFVGTKRAARDLIEKYATESKMPYVNNRWLGGMLTNFDTVRESIKKLEKYGIEVELKKPEMTVEQYEQLHGGPLHQTNPDQCCLDRKIRVLQKAVVGMHAWMSGIRRDQSPDRAQAAIVGWDKRFNLVKISPLANMTKSEIWKRILSEEIPYNPLHDKGYPSIGCWPCTRQVAVGEDERSGRWSGTGKIECGLHSIEFEQGGGI